MWVLIFIIFLPFQIENYFNKKSKLYLNLGFETSRAMERMLGVGVITETMFDPALTEVQAVMINDSFRRFLLANHGRTLKAQRLSRQRNSVGDLELKQSNKTNNFDRRNSS